MDLYTRHNGRWRWAAAGRPEKTTNEQVLISEWRGGAREYILYLPLYNGVQSVEIGVPEDAEVAPGPKRAVKPVVYYGSSILQGGCASRPGMAYPAIVSRMVEAPQINLGFSGNGRSEPEMARLMAELDPSAYVYDSLPNLTEDEIERMLR